MSALFFDNYSSNDLTISLAQTMSCNTMKRKWCNVCCVSLHFFPKIPKMLQVFKEVQQAAGNQAVVFLVQYPAVNADLWKATLTQYFQRHHNRALQYHIDNAEGEDVNVAVICTGQPTEDVKIKSVRICQAPPPVTNLHFGNFFSWKSSSMKKEAEARLPYCGHRTCVTKDVCN